MHRGWLHVVVILVATESAGSGNVRRRLSDGAWWDDGDGSDVWPETRKIVTMSEPILVEGGFVSMVIQDIQASTVSRVIDLPPRRVQEATPTPTFATPVPSAMPVPSTMPVPSAAPEGSLVDPTEATRTKAPTAWSQAASDAEDVAQPSDAPSTRRVPAPSPSLAVDLGGALDSTGAPTLNQEDPGLDRGHGSSSTDGPSPWPTSTPTLLPTSLPTAVPTAVAAATASTGRETSRAAAVFPVVAVLGAVTVGTLLRWFYVQQVADV